MNCREIQRQISGAPKYDTLSRPVQKHLEHCVDCQGFYPTRPALKAMLFEALPEIEPDRRLLAAVRQRVDQEMDKPAWSLAPLFQSLSFAGGVAALAAVLALPMLWMGSDAQPDDAAVARAQRIQAQSSLAGSPFKSTANPLVVADSVATLQRAARPQIPPGSVLHVIYTKKQQKPRAVVHY